MAKLMTTYGQTGGAEFKFALHRHDNIKIGSYKNTPLYANLCAEMNCVLFSICSNLLLANLILDKQNLVD